jgi:hypothetical protein
MADEREFVDGPTRHFLMDERGLLYEVPAVIAERVDQECKAARVKVERVDPDTNTIWFTSK